MGLGLELRSCGCGFQALQPLFHRKPLGSRDPNSIQRIPESWNMGLGGFVLGSLILYLKGMRRMMFQLSGFYYIPKRPKSRSDNGPTPIKGHYSTYFWGLGTLAIKYSLYRYIGPKVYTNWVPGPLGCVPQQNTRTTDWG